MNKLLGAISLQCHGTYIMQYRAFVPFLNQLGDCCHASTTVSSCKPDETEGSDVDKLYKMVEIEVRGNDPAVLKSYQKFATMAANELDIVVGQCWSPRKAHHERLTLLKSIHIYKKHRVQYEVRTYFRFMQFLQLTGSTAETFLEYIQRNLPEGVAMKTTRVEVLPLPQHLQPSSISDSNRSLKQTSSMLQNPNT